MTFTTRNPAEPCDKSQRKGCFHIRGTEHPPGDATQIEWCGREGMRNGEYSMQGHERDTQLSTSDGTTWNYSTFRGQWYNGNMSATLPGNYKNISKVNMKESDHFADRQHMDEDE